VGLELQISSCSSSWATLQRPKRVAYADSRMKDGLLALLHLVVMAATLCGRGGVRAVIAKNLVLHATTEQKMTAGRRHCE
jgi:hypothetical protein